VNLQIAGGVYLENCVEPEHHRLFGSAGRAAASISNRNSEVTVVTVVADSIRPQAEELALEFDFGLAAESTEYPVTFDYIHSLSIPRISPSPELLRRDLRLKVESERVVRFGMMEATVVTTARQVVYDPQSAFLPEHFGENGSRADELVIVANGYEAKELTGIADANEAAKSLLERSRAVAVVLKKGISGCLVCRRGQTPVALPAIPTRQVFKIGSGDIFSANLAHAWMVEGADLVEAARFASLATAHYVSQRYLPTPARINEGDLNEFLLPALEKLGIERSSPYDIYLAGPFFNLSQRWLIEDALRSLSEMQLRVFSPLHAVGIGPAGMVAPADLEGLKQSKIVLAMLDGLDPGTIFEIGYGRANQMPVLYYARNATEESLKMMVGTDCLGFDDFASSLYAAGWYARLLP
jgi:hypothetical protein